VATTLQKLANSEFDNSISSMEALIAGNGRVRGIRATAWLATGLGALALLLAAIGIYGVMAYAMTERRREIGIRMALGANRRDALRLILGQWLWLVTLGAALGSAAFSRLLRSFLFGLSPFDPIAYALVASLLMLVALVACLVPARRAMNVDLVDESLRRNNGG
jgi:ABC-type antimicrobial peptide transport system permease subunit